MPAEVTVGSRVFAATIAQLGSLRVRTIHVGAESTFGRVIAMVEEAEAHRAPVQRIADRFSAYFLPVVATIAVLTFLISRNALAAAAVLVVACSCSFALATPIAMLASIGAAASRGLLVKGGKYLEVLSRADVLLIDNALAHENLPLSHSLNALCVNHFLPVQQGHNVANLPSPKRQEANTMRSQRQISREATRGVSAASAGVSRAGLVQGE